MTITFSDLVAITSGKVIRCDSPDWPIDHLLTDSRKVVPSQGAVFFAIKGVRHNAHEYIQPLISEGIHQFVLEEDVDLPDTSNLNVIKVDSSLEALQKLATYQRANFDIPVVGITGSNGKTIVKEWLAQLLNPHLAVLKSPGSYNSQVGVPLSVWRLSDNHQMAIFEAGISRSGEMAKLAKIIRPSIGIFTTIGAAHDEGFENREQKIKEKAQLFTNSDRVIYCKDYEEIDAELRDKSFTWGKDPNSHIVISNQKNIDGKTHLELYYNSPLKFILPFTHSASVENAMHCIAFMLLRGFAQEVIQEGLNALKNLKMRLELKRGLNGCLIIDDTYNSDLGGLQVALDFLTSQKQLKNKTLIISDLLQTGLSKEALYESIGKQLKAASLYKVITIGPEISAHLSKELITKSYTSTEQFLAEHDLSTFDQELILVKGARFFKLEQIVRKLEDKIHGTHLEINLDALTHNLNFYRSKIKPGSKLMVMVKAFAYGSGSMEIANLLQYHRVDYLGVAYADEGVTLRRNGIHLPIMVMNPTEESF
ncbi:UDP-N-acetylmuramoyl-tripeptide--D-alanyl-D-alanine ligase, partial [Fulvivirga sp. RKSG066]|uniref:UDP-N-acetylmuramoyl-tripeptide--D-alanyl-D- alanine ligase n=1 Tax=Fulvivirga aurantia TaxID=2529383 RepID=UPI0012BD2503